MLLCIEIEPTSDSKPGEVLVGGFFIVPESKLYPQQLHN